MRGFRLWMLPFVMCLALATPSLDKAFAADDELPLDPPTTESSTTTYGTYEVVVDGSSGESVDTWDTTEPYLTTYLTTEIPSDSVIKVEMDTTVTLEAGEVESE